MKLFTLLMLLSSFATAHSQLPFVYGGPTDRLNSITLEQVVAVPISITTFGNNSQSYEVYSDDTFMGEVKDVTTRRHLKVLVKMNNPNTPETHSICSFSIRQKGGNMRTKFCTKVQLYWQTNE